VRSNSESVYASDSPNLPGLSKKRAVLGTASKCILVRDEVVLDIKYGGLAATGSLDPRQAIPASSTQV
jgi:hypothetical protein